MFNYSSIAPISATAPRVLSLSTRLTIASLVYFIEGVFASVVILFPQGQTAIVGGTLLAWANSAALWRFRESKLGAEIFDLYFFDAILATSMAICYAMGIGVELGVFVSGVLMFMRFTRIFAWQGTTTHDAGWGVFGPMSYFHRKKLGGSDTTKPMLQAAGLALSGAVIATILARQFSETTRVALVWACGLGFLVTVGPQLLRMVGNLILSATASNERESLQQARIVQLERQLAQQSQPNQLPGDVLDVFTAAYNGVQEDKRAHMLEIVQVLAKNYPAKSAIEK